MSTLYHRDKASGEDQIHSGTVGNVNWTHQVNRIYNTHYNIYNETRRLNVHTQQQSLKQPNTATYHSISYIPITGANAVEHG